MTADEFLTSIEELLAPANTGARSVTVCGDRMHAYEVLLDAPADAYRIALALDGDKPAANGRGFAGPAVELTLIVSVVRPMGLTKQPAKGVYKETAGGGVSLIQRADKVRRMLTAARWYSEPGVKRADIDPEGLRYEGTRIIHLEQDGDDGGFRPVAEQTWKVWIVLTEAAASEYIDLLPDGWTVANKNANVTLTATLYTDRFDSFTFEQTLPGITITLAPPSDASAKVLTIQNTGSAPFTLGPEGSSGGLDVGADTEPFSIIWDGGTGTWILNP